MGRWITGSGLELYSPPAAYAPGAAAAAVSDDAVTSFVTPGPSAGLHNSISNWTGVRGAAHPLCTKEQREQRASAAQVAVVVLLHLTFPERNTSALDLSYRHFRKQERRRDNVSIWTSKSPHVRKVARKCNSPPPPLLAPFWSPLVLACRASRGSLMHRSCSRPSHTSRWLTTAAS